LFGGSIVSRYVLRLLFSKNHKIADNLATAEAKEKSAHFWNP